MGACASRFKVLKDSGDNTQPPPVTKEEEAAAAVVMEEEVKDKDVGVVADDEAKHQSLGQMLIQENEGEEEGLVKNDSEASGELKQEDAELRENEALKSIQAAEKTEGKPIQISNLETVEDKTVAEPVKVVEFEGNEDSATDKKPEAKKIEENE